MNHPKQHEVARKFAELLTASLDGNQIEEIIKRNEGHDAFDDDTTCASYDFCDPNMLMLQAMKECCGIGEDEIVEALEDFDGQSLVRDCWNDAWGEAKRNKFWFRKIGNDCTGDVTPLASVMAIDSVEGNWVSGKAGARQVQIKAFAEPSEFGIGGGRISKLWISEPGPNGPRVLCNYDRGWDVVPEGDAAGLFARVLAALDGGVAR